MIRGDSAHLAWDRLELGKLYFKIVDFESATHSLKLGLAESRAAGDWEKWCKYVPLLLRIWAERLDFDSVNGLRAELKQLESEQRLSANSSTFYALGIASSYEAQPKLAESFFNRALSCAVDTHEVMQARFGLAAVDFQLKEYERAIERLHGLKIDLQPTLLTDLKQATGLLEVFALRYLKKYDQCLELLSPLQENCRVEQNLYMSLNVLFCYGTVYHDRGDHTRARQYFEMVRTLVEPRDLKHLAVQLEKRLAELDAQPSNRVQLELVEGANRMISTPERGEVEVGNQFILTSLLKLLAGARGEVLGKEQITKMLWKTEYNPLIHDNKIYVTVRRLRKLIEVDAREPFYILNAPDGYMFNPNVDFKVRAAAQGRG